MQHWSEEEVVFVPGCLVSNGPELPLGRESLDDVDVEVVNDVGCKLPEHRVAILENGHVVGNEIWLLNYLCGLVFIPMCCVTVDWMLALGHRCH